MHSSPTVIGIHPNAEIDSCINQTRDLWKNMAMLQPSKSTLSSASTREQVIASTVDSIMEKLPKMTPLDECFDLLAIRQHLTVKNAGEFLTPCQIVLLKELECFNRLCSRMSNSLLSLKKAAVSEILMTDQLEEISDSLAGLIPKYWKSVAPDTEKSLDSLMAHFSLRLEQYLVWIQEGELIVMWLGGLHFPESYLMTIVQTTLRAMQWPLDECALYTCVTKYKSNEELKNSSESTKGCYDINGLFLEGAGWDFERCCLKSPDHRTLTTKLPILQVVPVKSSEAKRKHTYRTPVYTTSARLDISGRGLVFEADLPSYEYESI